MKFRDEDDSSLIIGDLQKDRLMDRDLFLPLLGYYMLIKISFSNHSQSRVDSQVTGAQRATLQSPLQSIQRVPAMSRGRVVGAEDRLEEEH